MVYLDRVHGLTEALAAGLVLGKSVEVDAEFLKFAAGGDRQVVVQYIYQFVYFINIGVLQLYQRQYVAELGTLAGREMEILQFHASTTSIEA
jgi:hypothetical protein